MSAALLLHGNIVLGAISHQLLARGQVPFTPRGDDLYARHQRVGAQLETHLIVALAGGTMRDGVGASLPCNLYQALGDQRTCDGGTQQVLAFIDGVGAEHGEHEISHELLADIFDVDFLDAQGFCLGARGLHFLALAEVSGKGHHLAVIGIHQPFSDYGGVETSGVSQHDFVDIGHRFFLLSFSR